ncbi:hypothetical protein ABUR84_14525, partial [Staphylococcus aureus]|uniref:hypothetical protein n=1 Tax=Staphylococcus aureus TaxID=1280 RepID=UPI0033905E0A
DTIERAVTRKRGRKPAKSNTPRATVPGPDIQSHRGLVEFAMGRGSSEVDQLADLIERGRHARAKSGRHRADGEFIADRRLSTA